jgi:hypothetical protein
LSAQDTTQEQLVDDADQLDEYLTRHDDGTATLRLEYPVTLRYKAQGGQERTELLDELTYRRATGREVRAIGPTVQSAPLQAGLTLTALLTGKPDAIIDKLDGTDAMRAAGVAIGFLSGSRPKRCGGG